MTLKNRLTLAAALAVAVAVVLASCVVYVIVSRQLKQEVDEDLARMAATGELVDGPGLLYRIELPRSPLGGPSGYAQLVGSNGMVLWPTTDLLPVTRETLDVAKGTSPEYFSDMIVRGTHVRVLTTSIGRGLAVQLARPLGEVDSVLTRLRWILAAIIACGVALAAGLGGVVARTTLMPLRRLTDATEHIATTSDLTHRIEVVGDDEVSRLAKSFNVMLDALEASLTTQRQLVADASHELRTPLTSLRTNVEVLANESRLTPDQRASLRRDIIVQLEELTALITDVVDLARGNEPATATEDVRLDDVVRDAIERARRTAPAQVFDVSLEPTVVVGVAQRLGRAVNNLIDNAVKWNAPGSSIEVRLEDGVVTVRDHGPGIGDEDLPHVFDRFYRSEGARGMPGSGLGLAIVKQTAEAHGGRVEAANAEGGGAVFRLHLPKKMEPEALTVTSG